MADITQDSFVETNRFSKVIFQRGRPICDYELNELQDDQRVMMYRTMFNGVQNSPSGALNPGSNDDGWQVQGTGASNQVNIGSGFAFFDGVEVYQFTSGMTFTLPAHTPSTPRTDVVYLSLQEVEVSDPYAFAQIGPTTTRRQIQPTLNVSTTGPSTGPGTGGVPVNSTSPIWEGGIHYYVLANIARSGTSDVINSGDVTDNRGLLPPSVIPQIVIQQNGQVVTVTKGSGWTATVGDGVTSFGDYSGTNAIQQAIAAATSAGASTVHLIVKPGTAYVVPQGGVLAWGADISILIEGTGSLGTTITCTSGGSGACFSTNSNAGCTFEFRNLSITGTTTTNAVDFTEGTLFIKDCYFTNCGVSAFNSTITNGSTPFIAERSTFDMHSASSPTNILKLTYGALSVGHWGRAVFEDCYLATANNTPAVLAGPSVSLGSTATVWDGVYFIRCEGHWAEATNNSGVLTGNPTAVDFVTGGSGNNNLFTIKKILFEECQFYGGADNGGSGSSILLHIQPWQNGDSSLTNGKFIVNDVEIRGGHWEVPDVASLYNAITVISRQVTISNFWLRCNGVNGGTATSDVAPAFSSSTPALADWAQVVVNASSIDIDGFYPYNLPRLSGSGDIWLVNSNYTSLNGTASCRVSNVNLSNYIDEGSGAALPNHRCKFSGATKQTSIFENIYFVGDTTNTTAGHYYVNQTNLNEYGYIVLWSNLTLRDFEIAGASISSTPDPTAGICISGPVGAGSGSAANIDILHGSISGCGYGIRLDGGHLSVINSITVDSCNVSDNTNDGIYLTPQNGCKTVYFTRNYFFNNGGYAINLYNAEMTLGDSLTITDNQCYHNNSATNAVQINLVDSSGVGPLGVFMNNDLGLDSAGQGQLYIRANGSTVNPNEYMVGFQTGYTVSGSSTTTSIFGNTNSMMFNRGVLSNP